jgi:hypothetical protein
MKIVKFVKNILFLQAMRQRVNTMDILTKYDNDRLFDLDEKIWNKMESMRMNFKNNKRARKQLRLACKLLKVDYLNILNY